MKKIKEFRQLAFAPGSFLTIGSPVITEIAAQYPFSWLLLDMEHGGFTAENIGAHLQILSRTNIMSIVRVPATDPALIARLLDAGADGIMIPHVISTEQIEDCRKLMYYPPEGKRGFSSSVRQFGYGNSVPEDLSMIDKPLLFVQIEDAEGVANVTAIAGSDGVDVLFVGPADLKLSLKHQDDHKLTYEKSLQLVAEACKMNNKKAGILIRDKTAIGTMKESGYTCIAVDSDMAILRTGYGSIAGLF